MYKEFAKAYDDLMVEVDYHQWGEYVYRLLFNARKEVRTILEFGCGTGNITLELAKKGFEITAVDISEEMLTLADEKLNANNLDVNFYLGDMENFYINEKFDAIIACCDSVNYLKSEEALFNFLKSCRVTLHEDGILMFDLNTPYKYEKVIEENVFVFDQDSVFCVWENHPDYVNGIMQYDLTFFTKEKDGRYIKHHEVQTQTIFDINRIPKLLKEAGFKNYQLYHFGSYHPVNEGTERIQVVAQIK
jgi:ubiquinone/menaquinone biosynthesis C-methylase UbiE